MKNHMKLTRMYSQMVSFLAHAHTLKNTFGEMAPVWDELKDADGRSLIVEEMMTRTKAQQVQLYARRLMNYVSSISGLDMFPMSLTDVKIGNWRVDSIIIQIASNEIKGHSHLFKLLMVNLYGVPQQMIDFVENKFNKRYLKEYMEATYMGIVVDLGGPDQVTMESMEELMQAYMEDEVNIIKLPLAVPEE